MLLGWLLYKRRKIVPGLRSLFWLVLAGFAFAVDLFELFGFAFKIAVFLAGESAEPAASLVAVDVATEHVHTELVEHVELVVAGCERLG